MKPYFIWKVAAYLSFGAFIYSFIEIYIKDFEPVWLAIAALGMGFFWLSYVLYNMKAEQVKE